MSDLSFMEQLLSEDRDRFTIGSDAQAEWAARKIQEREADCDRVVSAAEAMIAFYNERIHAEKMRCADDTSFLKSHIRAYFDTVPHKITPKGTQASYRLPGFVCKEKYPDPLPKTDDAAALLAWARTSDSSAYVRIREEPAWSEIKADCIVEGDSLVHADTGEIVPGVIIERRPPVFTIEPIKGAYHNEPTSI